MFKQYEVINLHVKEYGYIFSKHKATYINSKIRKVMISIQNTPTKWNNVMTSNSNISAFLKGRFSKNVKF